MELIASQETGIFMFHLRDDVLLVLVFRLFQKPREPSVPVLWAKIRIKELPVPVISKTWKGLAVFRKESAIYGQRSYGRLFEKNSKQNLRIMVIYKTQVLDFLESHFWLQRTALITVRGLFLFLINTQHYGYIYYIRPWNSVKK